MESLEFLIEKLINRIDVLENKVNSLLADNHTQENSHDDSDDKKGRDKTKYMYKGAVYPKNQLVLAIVREYVKQNPNVSYKYLSKVFDKSLQGSLGVVRLYEEVAGRPDAQKRFFMNDVIQLPLNERVVVCTQWGAFNIEKFTLRARELGFIIHKI